MSRSCSLGVFYDLRRGACGAFVQNRQLITSEEKASKVRQCENFGLRCKTSHGFPQQSLVCHTVKLKTAHSHHQTAIHPPLSPIFCFSLFFTLVRILVSFFFVFFPLNVPSGSCLKKKNKDICKILWFIFAMIGSTASFHMTDSSWEDLARPGVLQIPKYPKCGLHLQETCLRTLNTCSQKTCSSSNLAGSFLRLYIF